MANTGLDIVNIIKFSELTELFTVRENVQIAYKNLVYLGAEQTYSVWDQWLLFYGLIFYIAQKREVIKNKNKIRKTSF